MSKCRVDMLCVGDIVDLSDDPHFAHVPEFQWDMPKLQDFLECGSHIQLAFDGYGVYALPNTHEVEFTGHDPSYHCDIRLWPTKKETSLCPKSK